MSISCQRRRDQQSSFIFQFSCISMGDNLIKPLCKYSLSELTNEERRPGMSTNGESQFTRTQTQAHEGHSHAYHSLLQSLHYWVAADTYLSRIKYKRSLYEFSTKEDNNNTQFAICIIIWCERVNERKKLTPPPILKCILFAYHIKKKREVYQFCIEHCDSASKTNAGYLLGCRSLKCRRQNAVCLGIMSPRKLLFVVMFCLFNGGNLERISWCVYQRLLRTGAELPPE